MVPSATPSPPTEPLAARGTPRRRILVATDGSASTTEAIGAGLRLLAPGMDVEVVGVAAIGDALLAAIPGPGLMPPCGDAQPSTGVDGRPSHEALERTVAQLGVPAEPEVLGWPPGPALCRQAAAHGVDAVMIVHPRDPNPVERLRGAALTRYVVEHAPCPVLVTR